MTTWSNPAPPAPSKQSLILHVTGGSEMPSPRTLQLPVPSLRHRRVDLLTFVAFGRALLRCGLRPRTRVRGAALPSGCVKPQDPWHSQQKSRKRCLA